MTEIKPSEVFPHAAEPYDPVKHVKELQIDRLKRLNATIELADPERQEVVFSDGTVLPITRTFDCNGNPTDDRYVVRRIEFGSDEAGYGEMEVDGVKWVMHQ